MKLRASHVSLAILILSVPLALATSVQTDYEGEGDLFIGTLITSNVMPTIYDTVEAHTACGGDPCCPDACCLNSCVPEEGSYTGYQFTSNDPASWSEDYGEVENGCIELREETIEYVVDENEGLQTVYTTYSTGVNGTGYAYSWVSSVPLYSYAYQYARGSGDTWAYFSQLSEMDGEFDFEALFGGGTYDCDLGYVLLEGEYNILNSPVLYNPLLMEMYCMDSGYAYSVLHGKATDLLDVNVSAETDYMGWFMEAHTDGQAQFDMTIDSDEWIDFDFDMVLE